MCTLYVQYILITGRCSYSRPQYSIYTTVYYIVYVHYTVQYPVLYSVHIINHGSLDSGTTDSVQWANIVTKSRRLLRYGTCCKSSLATSFHAFYIQHDWTSLNSRYTTVQDLFCRRSISENEPLVFWRVNIEKKYKQNPSAYNSF